MSEEKSIAEICRDYISQKHNEDAEYWNKVSVSQRNRDFKFFCEKSNDKVNYDKHHSVFTQQIKKLSKELSITPKTQREPSSAPTKKYQTTTGSQKGQITVAPKSSSDETIQPETGLQPVGSTQQGQQEKKILHPTGCQCFECEAKRGNYEFLDAETCGAIPEILVDLWHARNSKVKPLSDDEIKRVGKALRPLFAKYVGQDILLFLTPIVVVGQIVSSRYSQSKDGESKKKKKDYSDEPDEGSNTDDIEKETSPTRRKFYSSSKVDAIRKDADEDD